MSKIAKATQTAAVMALLSSNAVASSLPGFVLAAQTPHFSFYSRGEKVEAERSERYLAEVEKMLGHDFDGHASYYRYETPEQVAVATGAYAQGVTYAKRGEIHSTHG